MILLTVPVFYPVVAGLYFGDLAAGEILIWFGILVVVITEISLITPPVGMNVFVLKGILREVPTGVIFAGILPFLWSDVIRLALLVFFPRSEEHTSDLQSLRRSSYTSSCLQTKNP